MNLKELLEPFNASEVGWIITSTFEKKGIVNGFVVPYVKVNAIQERLDQVVGANNWKVEFKEWQPVIENDPKTNNQKITNSQLCGISIWDEEKKEWITKWNGAANTTFEPIKGGLSSSFKRSATMWGIGRYIKKLSPICLELESNSRGKGVIKKEDYPLLQQNYANNVAKLFNNKSKEQLNKVEAFSSNNKVEYFSSNNKEELLNALKELCILKRTNIRELLIRYGVKSFNDLDVNMIRDAMISLQEEVAN